MEPRKLDEKTLRDFIVSKQDLWFTCLNIKPPEELEGQQVTFRDCTVFKDYMLAWANTRIGAGQDVCAGMATVTFIQDSADSNQPRSLPILAIQYSAEQFVNSKNRRAVNSVLRRALRKGPDDEDFYRGPRRYFFRNFTYTNEQTGDITNFNGTEHIHHSSNRFGRGSTILHSLEYECRPLVKKLP
jgi:hypothetical protein